MTLEQLYLACNNMNDNHNFEIAIVKGLDLVEDNTFHGWYDIPQRLKEMRVITFVVGSLHYIILSAN